MSDTLLAEAVRRFLVDDEWPFDELDQSEAPMFRTGFRGEHGSYDVFITASDTGFFKITVLYRMNSIPEASMPVMLEFCNRANRKEWAGSLEMDDDRDVRYRVGVYLGDTLESATPQLISNALYLAVHGADDLYPPLMAVLFGGRSPVEALAESDGDDRN